MFFPECPFHGGPVQAIGCRATNPQCLWERHSQGCWRGRALSMQFANDHPGRSQHFPLKRIEQVLFLWQVISEQFRILKTNELLHIGGSKGALSPGAEVERLRRTNDALCQQASGISGDAKTTTSRHAQLSGAWSRRRGPFCRSSRTGGSCMAFVWDFIRKTTWRRSPKPWELHQKSSRDLRLGLRFDKIYDIYYSTYSNAPSMNQTGIKQYSTKAWLPVKPGFCPRWRRRPGNPRWDWQTRAPGHWIEHVRQVRLTLSAYASRKIMCSKCNMFAEHENWQSENDRIASWKYSCREFMKTLSSPWVDSLIWITVALVHLRLPLWRVPDRRSWARMPRPRPRWSRQTRGTRWIKRIRVAKSHEPIWVAALIGRKAWLHFNTIIKKESRFGAPKTEKAHPKRFDIYWPFMLYFRFRMSAKSVNICKYQYGLIPYRHTWASSVRPLSLWHPARCT